MDPRQNVISDVSMASVSIPEAPRARSTEFMSVTEQSAPIERWGNRSASLPGSNSSDEYGAGQPLSLEEKR
jgi:hypothetical protein